MAKGIYLNETVGFTPVVNKKKQSKKVEKKESEDKQDNKSKK